MQELSNLFKPITVNILNKSDNYMEIVPCNDLNPYIRCFWGSPAPYRNKESTVSNLSRNLVIPDCCMDIIFDIDYCSNKLDNLFCSINDSPFYTAEVKKSSIVSTFGIRFNFWAVHLFSDKDLPKACNEFSEVDNYFKNLKKDIENIVIKYHSIKERVYHVEKLLLRKLYNKPFSNSNLLNGVYHILQAKGATTISNISQYTCVSSRQLERIFREYIGITPKKCCSLVRYQNIWKDLVYKRNLSFSDITYNYGYSDQAHMINDFKKYHGSTPSKSIEELNKGMSHFYNTKID
ncbi:helix-turn-helix domain-containing protein [Clostridium aciditolerans]|uniref:AraC family transcriptional regulator n=1 Tax=Clostridium aciditolerans TaxID=339861 RepID=A0A934M580_9CLOT|nr:AraC family transcriptional regulator [Clostridium aciditolerans]